MRRCKKLPISVTIGGLLYKIKYVKPGSCKELTKKDAGCVSQHDLTIWIDKNAELQIQLLTLFHEILHGIAFIAYPTKSDDFKEHLASSVSDLLLQALQSAKMLTI